MTDSHAAQSTRSDDNVTYPEQHVLAILDTAESARAALDALAAGGFVESELSVLHGPEEADRLDAGTGRTGLLDRVLRFAERIGIRNDELAVKDRYEDALRARQYVVMVLAPTDERKDRAAALLAAHGGRFVHYFGRLTLERLSA